MIPLRRLLFLASIFLNRAMLTRVQDLMYKSVGIRDSRHGLQLNTSLWRLSWITFIFLPLTFTVGFFGMRVTTFSTDISMKWYFIAAVPLMAVVLLGWYIVKSFLLRRRQTPYSRGIYDVSISWARFFLKCAPVLNVKTSFRNSRPLLYPNLSSHKPHLLYCINTQST